MEYPTDNIRLHQYRQLVAATNNLKLWEELTDMEQAVRHIHPFPLPQFNLYISPDSVELNSSMFRDESFFEDYLSSAVYYDTDHIYIRTSVSTEFMGVRLVVTATTYITIPESYKETLRKISVLRTIYPKSYESIVCSAGE